MKRDALYSIVALAALALVAGPIGIAVFVLGSSTGLAVRHVLGTADDDGPRGARCALRLRYGPRPRYLGLGIVASSIGVFMDVRHSALHLWRDVGQGFSLEILEPTPTRGRRSSSGWRR